MNEADEEFGVLHLGLDKANVVLCFEDACGEHLKIMSARVARELADAVYRMADKADRQLPAWDKPEQKSGFPLLLIVSLTVLLGVWLFKK